MAFFNCGCQRSVSPDVTILQIRNEMRRGQLDAALHDVDAASAKYQKNPEWAARFRVLKAHVIFLRGSYNDALALLSPELPAPLTHTDAAVQRRLVQGLAYTYLQQYDQADGLLSEAETFARSIDSSFLGDVFQARGILEIDRKRYLQADSAFRNALSFARQKLKNLRMRANIRIWTTKNSLGLKPSANMLDVEEAFLLALRNYVPQTYDGDANLFRAKDELCSYSDPTLGWGGLIKGRLDILEISGDHDTILHEPHVQVLAEKLKIYIERALMETTQS